jgi:hypothetical protein
MRVSNKTADMPIISRQPFAGSNFYGVQGSGSPRASERWYLGGAALEAFAKDQDAGEIAYSVWSYATPIAWYTKRGEWVVPADKYSHTTGRHQGIVRRAIGLPRGAVRATIA